MRNKTYNRNSEGAVASLVCASNPAFLAGFSGYNYKTSSQFIQIHDAASLPADGAVPRIVFSVAASDDFAQDFNMNPREFAVGIVICNSSTEFTKTIGSADCQFDVQMKAKVN